MKKRMVPFGLFFIFLIFMGRPAPALANEGKIIFSTMLGWGTETDAQYSFFFSELFNYLKDRAGLVAEQKIFNSESEFFDHVGRDKPEFALVGNRELLVRMMRDYGYSPAMSYEFKDLKQNSACIYANKESGTSTVSELRGKSLSAYSGAYAYAVLWNLAGERPDFFFKQIEISQSGLASMYLFALSDMEAVLTTEQIVRFLKVNNPGIVRNLKKLACSEKYPFLPLLKSKDVPETMSAQLNNFLQEVSEGKQLGQYAALFQFQKLRFTTVDREDYRIDLDFFAKAEENGWVKAYREWTNSLEEKER